MSRLVSRRPPKRAPIKVLARHRPSGDLRFFDEVRGLAERGIAVRILRCQFPFYDVVLNGVMWMARNDEGTPIGSFETVEQAVAAGDEYDQTFYDPRGAA